MDIKKLFKGAELGKCLYKVQHINTQFETDMYPEFIDEFTKREISEKMVERIMTQHAKNIVSKKNDLNIVNSLTLLVFTPDEFKTIINNLIIEIKKEDGKIE